MINIEYMLDRTTYLAHQDRSESNSIGTAYLMHPLTS
jgi:hypothetical protein